MKLTFFEIRTQGEKEWILANTNIEALQVYEKTTGNLITDFDAEDEIVSLSEEECKEMMLTYPDDNNMNPESFYDYANKNFNPHYVGSTVY